jgi:DNA-binding beta-propeller fold protein YncE
MKRAYLFFVLVMIGSLAIGCSSKSPSTPIAGGLNTPLSYSIFHTIGMGGSGSNGTFEDGPSGLAVALGAIYVADSGYSAIDKFDLQGNFLGQYLYHSNEDIGGIAADRNGNVYATNYENGSVDEFDKNLHYIHSFTGGQFGINYNFSGPYGVTLDNDRNLYVADYSAEVVYKVNQSDNIIATSSGPIPLSEPYQIARDSNGNLYVADYDYERITIFNSSLVSTGSFDGSNGAAAFSGPTGVSVDSQGNLIVADYDGSTVRSYTTSGVFLRNIGNTSAWSSPFFTATDGAGSLYVSDFDNEDVTVLNP